MNITNTDIILASKSPRRMELMKQAGYDFKIVTSDTPEITTKTAPFDVSMELSSIKAFGVANMWEAVFADVGVSVIAILNSMRTLKEK